MLGEHAGMDMPGLVECIQLLWIEICSTDEPKSPAQPVEEVELQISMLSVYGLLDRRCNTASTMTLTALTVGLGSSRGHWPVLPAAPDRSVQAAHDRSESVSCWAPPKC